MSADECLAGVAKPETFVVIEVDGERCCLSLHCFRSLIDLATRYLGFVWKVISRSYSRNDLGFLGDAECLVDKL